MTTPPILVTAPELSALRESAAAGSLDLAVLDVRWRLDRPDGRPDYLAGHVPGAVYVDLGAELAAHGAADGRNGRHPLPAIDDLQAAARRWGVRQGGTVVVYDDLANQSAARAWWLLRWAGISDVRVLDGALGAWRDAGLELAADDVVPPIGDVELVGGALPVLDIGAAAALPATGVLLDARAGERYRGDVEPIDPRAGHIPGALSAPTSANVDAAGRFLPADSLRERFTELGVSSDAPVGAYCGSGVTASHEALALTLAGFAPALYPGSWSQWSQHPDRPVATGPDPE